MGKKMKPELLLLFLSMAVFWLEAKINISIYLPSRKLSWDEARLYCQKNYIDMVTWDVIDPDLLTELMNKRSTLAAWIGLHEDPEQLLVWRWINVKTGKGLTGDDVHDSLNWGLGQQAGGSCGSYNMELKECESRPCFAVLPFICYADNLVVVNSNKTWEGALNHCRGMTNASHKYDLLSISKSSDYGYVSDRIYGATTDEVWTGLRFLGGEWWLSDGESLDHQEMLPDCPGQWKHCGTVPKNNTDNEFTTADCSERRNFICSYEEVATEKEGGGLANSSD